MRGVYAFICELCAHPSSDHRAKLGGAFDLRVGPYRCLHCSCEIRQDGPSRALTRRQWINEGFAGLPYEDQNK